MPQSSLQDYLEIKQAYSGRLSPNQDRIIYLSNDSGTPQIYLTDIKGEDHQQITNYEDDIDFVVYSPVDNSKIIFGKSSGGDENMQLFLHDIDDDATTNLSGGDGAKYYWGGWSRDGRYLAYSSNARNSIDFDSYVMDLNSEEAKCVFDEGGWSYMCGFSPQNTYAVLSVAGSNINNNLYLIDLASGNRQLLTPHKEDAFYSSVTWEKDENGLYLLTNEDSDLDSIRYYSLESQEFKEVDLSVDAEAESVYLTKDGGYLFTTFNQDGYAKTYIYEAESLKPVATDLPEDGFVYETSCSEDGSLFLYGHQSPTNNHNIYSYQIKDRQIRQITDSYCNIDSKGLVEPELIHYPSFDGLNIPAFIYRPQPTKAGKMPVIINIHGGPEIQYRPNFAPLAQYFVSQGYTYIAPNIRGSRGYGKTYMALDDVEKRLDSVKDIAWLHRYLEGADDVDEDRVALMGGSYGGYMVLACLAFYPKLWAAGVDIVGIANLATFLKNTSAYRRKMRESEYGSLEKDRELLESISPSNHVEAITAPLLIIHGVNDPRVPLSEAELIKSKLEEKGQTAKLLIYEDEGHGLAKLKNRLDAYPKVVEFLDSVLK